MVIVSQCRKKIINFDQVIYIDAENIADRWQINAYLTNNKLVTLGVFYSEKDIEQEIKEIYKAIWQGYRYHKIAKLNENNEPYSPVKRRK